ncbi:EAL domain-containing protein [Shewanella mesophila]|nr:EAL domain-containing protein [Shewanella mesophila]
MLLSGSSLSDILSALVLLIEKEKLGTRASVLVLSDDRRHLLLGAAPNLPQAYNDAIHGVEIGLGVGSCGEAAFSGQRVIVDDISTHPNWVNYKGIALAHKLLACWSEPIKGSNGDVLGTFAMYYENINAPSDTDLILIQEAARLASLAIERSKSFQFQRQTTAIFNNLPIALVTTSAQWSILDANDAFWGAMATKGSRCDVGYFNPNEQIGCDTNNQHMIHALMANGHWQGEALIKRFDGSSFYADLTAMRLNESYSDNRAYAWLISDISARKQASDLIEYQANFDALTQLPNRTQLLGLINQHIDARHGFALMLMDVDNFKQVNDTLGHGVGDRLLVEIGKRLLSIADDRFTVARLGGDEFAILIPDVLSIDQLNEVSQRIDNLAATRYQLSGSTNVYSTLSLGIARYPDDAESLELILNCADQAMYVAKRSGKNRSQLFNFAIRERDSRAAKIHAWLQTAIELNEFELYYQPIINLQTGKIVHAEALLRWCHGGQFISPQEFIPVAEASGLILGIGEWVRKQAITFLHEYRDYPFTIAINVSVEEIWSHLLQEGLIASIEKTAAAIDCNFPYERLTIEITESLLMGNQDTLIDELTKLKAKGCRIAIDDFGTGYSSLAYLNQFPIDELKIDKSFVLGCEYSVKQQALIKAIAKMSQALELVVVAEGIENSTQLEIINSVGIDLGQGYLFSKPIPKAQFVDLLRKKELFWR